MDRESDAGDEAAPCLLIVDDDPGIRQLVAESLTNHGYRLFGAGGAAEMDRILARERIDLVILDVMMPGEDGLSICRRLAQAGKPPIIIMSAMGGETDRIVGLEMGADGYLPKPCSPRELLAHVRSVLRRSQQPAPESAGNPMLLGFAGWTIDLVSRELTDPDGVLINLSDGEFSLLRAFVERPRRVLTREQLLDSARGGETEVFDRAIDVQVSRLRRKLHHGGQEIVRTVRNEGYMFTAPVARA